MSELTDHPILPALDFQLPRSSVELWSWYASKKNELDEHHQGQKFDVSTNEMWDRFLGHPNVQKFLNEVRPLAQCARAGLFGSDAQICITTNYERYDAVILKRAAQERHFVEVTTTVDGQEQRISYLHCRKYGRSPAFQKIRYEGTKNTRYKMPDVYKSEDKPIAVSVDEIFEVLWQRISKRVREKEAKDYPDGTWLVVSFEDFLTFASEDLMAEKLKTHMAAEILGQVAFNRITLAGSEGRILLDADNREEPKISAIVSTI